MTIVRKQIQLYKNPPICIFLLFAIPKSLNILKTQNGLPPAAMPDFSPVFLYLPIKCHYHSLYWNASVWLLEARQRMKFFSEYKPLPPWQNFADGPEKAISKSLYLACFGNSNSKFPIWAFHHNLFSGFNPPFSQPWAFQHNGRNSLVVMSACFIYLKLSLFLCHKTILRIFL